MKVHKVFLIIILLCFTTCLVNSQSKPLLLSSGFVHKKTSTIFPYEIDSFKRTLILSHDKSKNNISVTYIDQNDSGNTTLTIYIYPSEIGTENMLRKELIKSLEAITSNNFNDGSISKFPVRYCHEGYNINGLKAGFSDKNGTTRLLLYECGKWLLKFRIISQKFDSLKLDKIEKMLTERFGYGEERRPITYTLKIVDRFELFPAC